MIGVLLDDREDIVDGLEELINDLGVGKQWGYRGDARFDGAAWPAKVWLDMLD